MIDDCTVFFHSSERVMVMGANPQVGEDLAAAAHEGVSVRERRSDFAQIAIQGPKSRALLQSLTTDDLSNAALPYYSFKAGVTVAGIPMQISRLGFTGELGYELLLPVDETRRLWRALTEAGAPLGFRPAGGAGLMTARIEAGLIMGGLDYDETSTPWECRMGWAVDLAKDSFQGKAALIASRGNPRQVIVTIAFAESGLSLDGAAVLAGGREIGAISMAVPSPVLSGRPLALVRVDPAFAAEGTAVSAGGVAGEVIAMPVHDPESDACVGASDRRLARMDGEVPPVSWTPASFSFCCLVSKSTGDSMPLFVCLRFGL